MRSEHLFPRRLRSLTVAAALLSLAVLCAPAPSAQGAGGGLAPSQVARIERVITSEMSSQGIPGMSIAIATDLKLRWANGYGLADLENFVPATAETSYRLASIHKSMTAVAIMQLAEAGKLDLDAPIQRYVPTFPVKKWPVTARNLLYHVSGIRSYKQGEMESTTAYTKLGDGLKIFQDDPLEFEPGTKYLYSSQGYTLLSVALENASGMDYYDYVRKYIFEPAGMDSARQDSVGAIIPHRAQGYCSDTTLGGLPRSQTADASTCRSKTGGLRNSGLADTSNKGGLVANVVDTAKFAIAFLSGKLVKPETIQEMCKVHPATQRTRNTLGYSLGFQITWPSGKVGEGERAVWKTGDQQRVTGLLYMRPGRRCVVVFIMNLENAAHRLEMAQEISDIALEPATGTRP
jgi:serine beta-lactamase-like protein LACTB